MERRLKLQFLKFFTLITVLILADFSSAKIGTRLRRSKNLLAIAMPGLPPSFSWTPNVQTGDMAELGNNPQYFTLTNNGTGTATALVFNLDFEFVLPGCDGGFKDFGCGGMVMFADRFVITDTTCGASLPAGNSCNVTVEHRECSGGCTMMIGNSSADLNVSSDSVTSPSIHLTHSPLGTLD